ncbi:MAG TPA: ABC transporter ATP-binding protein [Egibacteraceae bacterium]|nr:ABC transporter ATP-binding protein [Egibacteraceae bacterium]
MAIRTQPRAFAGAVAGSALYALMTVAAAFVLGRVTDAVIIPAFDEGRAATAALAAAAGAIIGVALLKAVGIVTRRAVAGYMQLRLQAIFRQRVSRQIHQLPLAWHRDHPTGELLSNAGADVQALFGPIAPLPFSVGALLLLILAAGALLVTDPLLAAVAFALGPLMAVANTAYNRATERPAARVQGMRGSLAEVAHESFDGALVVKTLGREAEEAERFREAAERLRDELVSLGRLRAMMSPVIEALPRIGTLAILLGGALRVAGGQLTEGEVVRFVYLFTLIAFPMSVIGYLFEELPSSVAGWDRLSPLLGAQPDPREVLTGADGDVRLPVAIGPLGLEAVNVSFGYPGAPVLQDVTLSIRPGSVTAITGATGAGKSTLISLLVRLADPAAGAIRLGDADLRAMPRRQLARDVAAVFQHTFLFDDSVRGNITLGEDFSDEDVVTACQLAQADKFIRSLPDGYDTVLGERGASLSGGQRQRIALARALVRRPRLLLLDDATSSVDPTVEAAILKSLREAAAGESTVVVVAYRSAALRLCDEVVYLDGGRVEDRGAHEALLGRCPAYAQLVTAYERASDYPPEAP